MGDVLNMSACGALFYAKLLDYVRHISNENKEATCVKLSIWCIILSKSSDPAKRPL